jgi:hypothetical protein
MLSYVLLAWRLGRTVIAPVRRNIKWILRVFGKIKVWRM